MSLFSRWFPTGTSGGRPAGRRAHATRPAPEPLEGRLLLRCSLGSPDVPDTPQGNGIETWGVDRVDVHWSPGWPAHPVIAHHGVPSPDSPCWRFDLKSIDHASPSVRESMTPALGHRHRASLSFIGHPHRVGLSLIGHPLKVRPPSSR
jgi:hypothetical protein